jgi:phosphoribosylcarboxyaminoimidazole (NCAIR) mutase
MSSLVLPEGMRKIELPRVGTMFGSDTDLDQAYEAHMYLIEQAKLARVELANEFTNSIHRNPVDVIANLSKLIGLVDALLVGAGWANQLTGCVNAFLRNWYRDYHITIFGVAISDPYNPVHTQAAIVSITELPGSEVVFDNYVGQVGCYRAAKDMASGIYPIIKRKEQKPAVTRTMHEAAQVGWQERQKRLGQSGGV